MGGGGGGGTQKGKNIAFWKKSPAPIIIIAQNQCREKSYDEGGGKERKK